MAVSKCPACREEVLVPAEASPAAQVQCPLCQEEYELSTALAEFQAIVTAERARKPIASKRLDSLLRDLLSAP